MAKGTDSEEFVLSTESESRSGLKRDLNLALRVVHTDGSVGDLRRNWGNSPSSNGILGYSRKRFKKSGVKNLEKFLNDSKKEEVEGQSNTEKSPIEKAVENVLLDKPGEINCLNVPTPSNLLNVSDDSLMVSLSVEESKSNVVKPVSKEVPMRRFTRSVLKSKELQIVTTKETSVDNNIGPRVLVCCLRSPFAPEQTSGLHNAPATKRLKQRKDKVRIATDQREENKGALGQCSPSSIQHREIVLLANNNQDLPNAPTIKAPQDSGSSKEVATSFDTPTVAETNASSAKIPPRRFTRSALKFTAQPVIDDSNTGEVSNALVEKPLEFFTPSASNPNTQKMVINENNRSQSSLPDKSLTNVTCTDLKSDVEHIMIDNNRVAQNDASVPLRQFTLSALECNAASQVMDENCQVHNTLLETPPRRFTRSALESKAAPQVKDEIIQMHDTLLEQPPRRFTRSALSCNKIPHVIDGNSKVQNTLLEIPLRRFTRSTLKDETMGTLPTATSFGSHAVSEEAHKIETKGNIHNITTDVSSPVRTPAHKNLEMKMSKKIVLTNIPTKASELLETGMLEGLSVTYIFRAQQNGVLQGTIKDSGILCSCSLCNGCKVISINQFERHAGSGNRNPAYYLYLDNGNSLRDVLDACKDAPVDMLEATIQRAIKSSSVKNAFCLSCARPLPALKTRRTVVLCTSCLELKKCQASPSHTEHNIESSKALATPKNSDDASKCVSPQNKSTQGKITRKDWRLHKLVFEEDGLPDGTELAYYVRGQKLLEGYKKGFGIFCFCCNSEISPSHFEAHAGCANRRKPYMHIYTSNGVSLHELSISLSKGRKYSAKDNDDLCSICADFGDLLLCDGCPRAFHRDCVGRLSVPRGKWYCPYCHNLYNDQSCAHNANAKAAGRVSGVDPIEQISKRCIRIVKTETEVGGCTLCRVPGFSRVGFGPRTIILCDQCEKEFHVGCLRDHNMGDLKELPKGKWFCCKDCSRINSALQKCVLRGPEDLPDSVTKLIKMKRGETNRNFDISWRLISGKLASSENRSLLSKAVALFHDRFDPIVDAVTGRDLIPCMVYGRNIRDQEFGGMFCAVLTVNSFVVSAGLLRIFGQEVAELPLVATSSDYQGQGCFQTLFSCIERLLGFLNVRNLVLPAAEEAEAIWTDKFGFQKLDHDEMTKYTKEYQMTIFKETPILHKSVPKCRILRRPTDSS
ncbi:Increased dna methylation [Thalictrum thalictroides]|uniref:Increased dna methylation n=1 Tax=Thalictrum thalictroides TaxID=46969 RepID=A0A7J6W3S3_THATH|nr:Increased dna methylation [Thalictrum thalictroides]